MYRERIVEASDEIKIYFALQIEKYIMVILNTLLVYYNKPETTNWCKSKENTKKSYVITYEMYICII